MSKGRLKIGLIGTLLLAIFGWYWCSATLFSHEHFVNGERIVHSHPLAGSSHTHSSSQLQTISHLAMFLALVAPIAFALCKIEGFKSQIAIALTERAASTVTLTRSLRAPPVSLC